MILEPRRISGHRKAALAIPSSLAYTMGEDNLEMPPPMCTPRSEDELVFWLQHWLW